MQIEAHPEMHDQSTWGDGNPHECNTPCCVAGWGCRLGGGTRGMPVETVARFLFHADGHPMPPFNGLATREEILTALRG